MIEDCKSAKNLKAYRTKHQAEYQLHDSLKKELQDLGITKIPSSNKIQKRIEHLESEQAATVREKQELQKKFFSAASGRFVTVSPSGRASKRSDAKSVSPVPRSVINNPAGSKSFSPVRRISFCVLQPSFVSSAAAASLRYGVLICRNAKQPVPRYGFPPSRSEHKTFPVSTR